MLKRVLLPLAFLSLVALPLPVRAQEKAEEPTLLVRLRSLDGLIAHAQHLATLAGQEEQARQMAALIQNLAGDKGLKGIDTKRPLGLYGVLSPGIQDSPVVVLVPVSDEKEVLGLLENFNVKYEKGKDDVYTVSGTPVPVYFRFANKYAYVTALQKDPLAKGKFLDPATVFPEGRNETAFVSFHLDRVPPALKQIVLSQVELQLANLKDQKTQGETEVQKKLRHEVADELGRQISALVREGGEVSLSLNVDTKANTIEAEVSLNGKPGSALTARLDKLGAEASLFAGLANDDSATSMLMHLALPTSLHAVLGPVIDEGIRKGLDKEQDRARKAMAAKFLKAIEPSLKSGELDVAFEMRGPNKENVYTLLGALKVKDGAEIEKALRDMARNLPQNERDKIVFDKTSYNDFKIHQVEVAKEFDADARRNLGDNPLYFAIRNDAVLISGGAEGLEAIKEALAARPKKGPLFHLESSMTRLIPVMAKDQKNAPEAARKAFQAKGDDKIRLSVFADKGLRARFVMSGNVVKFFHLADQAKKE